MRTLPLNTLDVTTSTTSEAISRFIRKCKIDQSTMAEMVKYLKNNAFKTRALNHARIGAVAQLGERCNRTAEVVSSNLISSTNPIPGAPLILARLIFAP